MIVSFIIVGFGCFALIHLLYWSLPFSRKTTGIKEVDAAITRYKKQNEEVAGAWEPPAMVDGTWYKLISYQKGPGGVLAFDKQGEVVRDLELMHKIHRCSQLAIYAARPDMINQRTSGYMNTQKAIGLLKIGLKKYDGLVKPIRDLGQAVNIAHAENVRRALLISQRYFPAVCEGWYLEAEWSNQRGNAHLKEVHYEEMLELSNRISEKIDFMTAETAVLITGGESALALLKLLQKHGEIDRQSPDLKHLLDFVLQARETAEAIQQGVDSGDGIPSRYKGLDDEKIVLWRERLKWVDQVDKRKA